MNKIDDVDISILKSFMKNARASFREVASETGVAVGTVQSRVKKLEEMGILVGFRPDIDYNKMGYGVDAIIALKVRRDQLGTLWGLLMESPNVSSMYQVTGDFDVFVRVQFKDSSELADFLVNKLSDKHISSSVTYTVLKKVMKPGLLK